ncbi:PREDICTED: uncharacterized protein LOC106344250 [Brassica oleracea var. oleracea]|uniref:uncharacterized protein LOC106344250 n=1 Tax=Brassica oleracea var. oleracea TaxID=109376 RepID=UPI0006A70D29|nr:PREDICTED: uncharacterized protein LOC106344250 [Brassica oleracea var. oleracea]
MPILISDTQSAFVSGRAIADNVLITHETLHYLRTSEARKYCSMAVKTDMSKAYDRIEWGFAREVLSLLGFDPVWIAWIMTCIETVSYSFLINGTPQGRVRPSRGLRQGDPLSPYIFILCTEVLAAMCNKGQEDGSLPGVRVARGCPPINHLLFADDTMFFCKSNVKSVTALSSIISSYEALSGQKINTLKSSITFSAKTPPEVRTRVKASLSIDTEGGIGKYLGLPENFGRKKCDIFATIVGKIRQKALSWKSRFLSGAGKQIMLKSVLSAMPCYTMSCFKIPISLCNQIQSILTRFWWDANPGKRKLCWVAWSTLTLPKFAGGLGFRDIETLNDSLLAKVGWRLLKNPHSFLARVLLGKYARDSSFLTCTVPVSASHGWRSIIAGRKLLKKGLSWVVGNGESIRVWEDPWLSFVTPSRPVGPPSEFAYSLRVSDLLCPLSNQWDINRIREHLPQYEDCILRIVTSAGPSLDALVWLPEKNGAYSTKSGYALGILEKCAWEKDQQPLEWQKHIWSAKTIPKIREFLWRIVKKAIPVSENLSKRGVPPFNCKRCGAHEDDLHVFLTCPFAEEVWNLLPVRIRPAASLLSMAELIKAGSTYTPLPPSGLSDPMWPWVLWNLWKSRNQLMFENRGFSAQETALKCILDAKEWSSAQDHRDRRPLAPPLGPPSAPSTCRSVPPPSFPLDVLACKVDAAWDSSSGGCGIGGIFSGNNLKRIPNLSESRSHVSSALMAEAIAVRLAVVTAVYSNVRSLAVLTDSLSLVTLLKKEATQPELFGIMFDIYHALSYFDRISFHFISRTFNGEADLVAKSALTLLSVNSSVGG